jgi:hypothetical protein
MYFPDLIRFLKSFFFKTEKKDFKVKLFQSVKKFLRKLSINLDGIQ